MAKDEIPFVIVGLADAINVAKRSVRLGSDIIQVDATVSLEDLRAAGGRALEINGGPPADRACMTALFVDIGSHARGVRPATWTFL
jgi:hypothetical protein